MPLASAIRLALLQDPRVKLAQDELRRAIAARKEVKGAYLPSAAANGGAGYTYGITLTVLTIFTLDAQSLIYSPLAAPLHRGVQVGAAGAQVGMRVAREQVEEDVVLTYIVLDIARRWADTLDLVRARDLAQGRRERALADARGPRRSRATFNSQYARVSPIDNVTDYYNLRGRYNIFSFGAIVRFPFLDAASRARQREAQADAAHATYELASLQFRQDDDRRNLRHALAELQARLEVAQLSADIAAGQLALHGSSRCTAERARPS